MSSLHERFCSDSEIKQTHKSHNTSELLEVSQQREVNDCQKQHCSSIQACKKEILDLERETKLGILQTPVIYCSHYSKVDHCTQILQSVINSLKILFCYNKGFTIITPTTLRWTTVYFATSKPLERITTS